LAFFAARFSFRVLPGFFTLLFCGDLLDTTVLPYNIRMVRSDDGGTQRVHQPRPSQLRGPRADVVRRPRDQPNTDRATACRMTVSGPVPPRRRAGEPLGKRHYQQGRGDANGAAPGSSHQ
jgi:hypothetical protein